MNLCKLNAISSTNDYLKELVRKSSLDNYTVISTNFQTNGKGQARNKWISKKGKNLLFSVLIKFDDLSINKSAYLNFAISIGVYQVLVKYLPQTKIKWPNDILAGNKKICGILIENSVKKATINYSIVGIGLNVNQVQFTDRLPNATSFIKELNMEFDRDLLLKELITSIKKQITYFENDEFVILKATYENLLFKKNIPSIFKANNKQFMGKILGVSKNGLLQVELENGVVVQFANKEIVYL